MKKNTYYPEYVHSELDRGKFKMHVTITNECFDGWNLRLANKFCKDWLDGKHETFIHVEFDIKQIIDDALYCDRWHKREFKFEGKKDLQYLTRLQADLIKALARVNAAVAKVNVCHTGCDEQE